MANVTIAMDDQLLSEVRVEAARAGQSVSKYLADLIDRNLQQGGAGAQGKSRKEQIAALERLLSGPKWSLMRDGRMPTADERNER